EALLDARGRRTERDLAAFCALNGLRGTSVLGLRDHLSSEQELAAPLLLLQVLELAVDLSHARPSFGESGTILDHIQLREHHPFADAVAFFDVYGGELSGKLSAYRVFS